MVADIAAKRPEACSGAEHNEVTSSANDPEVKAGSWDQFASVASAQRAQPAIQSPMAKPPTRIMILAPTAAE